MKTLATPFVDIRLKIFFWTLRAISLARKLSAILQNLILLNETKDFQV